MTIDFVTIMGRLLCDAEMRQRFLEDRHHFLATLDLDDAACAALLSLDSSALQRQATGLLNKRYHEVRKLLPQTMARLGARSGALFKEFAGDHWPTTHQRHVRDAVAFGAFLGRREPQTVSRAELNRLTFLLNKRRIALAWLSDYTIRSRYHFAVQLLIRNGNRPTPIEHVWFLRLLSRLQQPPPTVLA